jgi:hypothetical protein
MSHNIDVIWHIHVSVFHAGGVPANIGLIWTLLKIEWCSFSSYALKTPAITCDTIYMEGLPIRKCVWMLWSVGCDYSENHLEAQGKCRIQNFSALGVDCSVDQHYVRVIQKHLCWTEEVRLTKNISLATSWDKIMTCLFLPCKPNVFQYYSSQMNNYFKRMWDICFHLFWTGLNINENDLYTVQLWVTTLHWGAGGLNT